MNTSVLFLATILLVAFFSTISASAQQQNQVTFPNGSTLVLNNTKFYGIYSNLFQEGVEPDYYDWKVSLAEPSVFPNCGPASFYAAQGSKCQTLEFFYSSPATPLADGSGVQFSSRQSIYYA